MSEDLQRPSDAPALAVDALEHSYGPHPALRGVSFSVGRGELFGLLGPNGGGKTTLLRAVTTLLVPTSGSTSVFGYSSVRHPAEVRCLLGVVFQEIALDRELTVLENLHCQAALMRLPIEARERRITALLEAFGLIDRAHDRVKTLSGGLARRTDLARGLLHRPPLLLLDEPTTGLDPSARRELWTILRRLQREDGTTIVVATHLMEEAERCDRVAILDRGSLVTMGAPGALRAALGGETLWLETREPLALRERLEAQLGLRSRVVGESLLVETQDAPSALASVMAAFPNLIEAATVRRPTLDDVFAARTGARIEVEHQPLPG